MAVASVEDEFTDDEDDDDNIELNGTMIIGVTEEPNFNFNFNPSKIKQA